jgi:polyisoprenoid-binding protein YceI
MAELPPEPGTWTIDSMHSFVTFTVQHFTIAFARGLASGPTGSVTIGEDPLASSVRASIDASTIATGNKMRDEKILGPDVLDVAKYPTIDFSSRALREESPGRYALDGDLTMHGITRPVTLDLTVHGVITDVWNKTRLGLTATAELKRGDFDVQKFGYVPLAAGGFMVPDSLEVSLEIEATRDEPAA